MSEPTQPELRFSDLDLPPALLAALDAVGYEQPSPIQAQAIPVLLEGRDLLGHAPTGTGKTAAFALPLMSRIDLRRNEVQVLVLAPTRELAIQVSEAFQRYASQMPGFHVMPIYGGQDYGVQIRQLKRGVHVVVGTPGRVMDHMRRGTLKLGGLKALVLDEADEMLRMGFIDDVEWVLEQLPEERQIALFSATMPREVERIARQHLREPREISIKAKTATAETIRQRYWLVSGMHKLDALTRILEAETFDAMIIFVRTKIATTELSERLKARGYAAEALNGDMQQRQREAMIARLKKGDLDILVATDVAARGLDVDRISHVLNYDIPNDTEAYVHRIGRTGRAGREGDAILFVAPRERRMLKAIERATRQDIASLELPTADTINTIRVERFKQSITEMIDEGGLEFMRNLLGQYQKEHEVPALEIAAALAKASLGGQDLLLAPDKPRRDQFDDKRAPGKRGNDAERGPRRQRGEPDEGSETYRIEVGKRHGVKPGNIVGAIANVAGLDGRLIGHIDIQYDHSYVDMPSGMPDGIYQDLRKLKIAGKRLDITRQGEAPAVDSRPEKPGHRKPVKPEHHGKPRKKAGGFKKKGGEFAKKPGKRKPGKKNAGPPGKKPRG
ncbi:DEAD/DEAH box helicase [Marinihelvus fidelis]|uniref:ATP-dependent RNA helicase DeaD n=1 Tax=Marinihelvus fidelis TaxID=2613842 RepID=A0A5N0TLG5_9GAMM|nr:DEAD/DEAH box helicase [Marinihelvus fidelis]KAA9134169.1 DEAD/DEAH box helicase [Marinihelvus fidelis]